MDKCINIDWLEVYVLEPVSHPITASDYERLGYRVVLRPYGTKIYDEVFTVYEGEFELLIVQRVPKSVESEGGVLAPGSCHIRMHNRFCYQRGCISYFRELLRELGYTFRSIKRVDICCDFQSFDSGERPDRFARKYIRGDYVKICQPKISAHGVDNWDSRSWNSFSWGSPTSKCRTRFYNKSLEMREQSIKPWIVNAWIAAGADSILDVWRVEFSLVSVSKQSWRNDSDILILSLSELDSANKLAAVFQIYASHYFRFKIYEEGKRKDRCRDKRLFVYDSRWSNYEPLDFCFQRKTTKTDKSFLRRLYRISIDEYDRAPQLSSAVNELVLYMCRHHGDVGGANSEYWRKLMRWGL